MEGSLPDTLSKILTPEELEQIPRNIQEKITKCLDGIVDEYCKEAASSKLNDEYKDKVKQLELEIQDYKIKLDNSSTSIHELRTQLDNVTTERNNLLNKVTNYEADLGALRTQLNAKIDERETLLKVTERQNFELERLHQETRSLQEQLKNAISAKFEALSRFNELESKESAFELKERRMEQERAIFQNQIQTLTDDLSRNISQLQNIRRDNALEKMDLEVRLSEKTEEVKIITLQCDQYKETIDQLTVNVQELSSKILNQNEEANKLITHYKKELDAKTKLAELYKSASNDTNNERDELTAAIADLRRILNETTDQYGKLETQYKAAIIKHEEELEDREKQIKSLKTEIQNANDLLNQVQHETMETTIAKIAPSAAVASRLIRTNMSLTELYSLYMTRNEELSAMSTEKKKLELQLNSILDELKDSSPYLRKAELENEKLNETNKILIQERDDLQASKAELEEQLNNCRSEKNLLERENLRLRETENDLSRQVIFLIKQIEQERNGIELTEGLNSENPPATVSEMISKNFVTFDSAENLVKNNKQLLSLVRQLSSQLQELEANQIIVSKAAYEKKLECYDTKIKDMQDSINHQNSTISTLLTKCERYKKLYFELQKRSKSYKFSLDESLDSPDESMDTSDNAAPQNTNDSLKFEQTIRDLTDQLNKLKEQNASLKEQYEERKLNEKLLSDQIDSMRNEVKELNASNVKLMTSAEYTKEQLKLSQKHIATYKQQIASLESRNRNYDNTIIKHENTIRFLKDEALKIQKAQASAESEANHLRHENRNLKDSISRLQSEKENLHRQQQNQNLLLNNLEYIKNNLERSETEGRMRLEKRLDDATRELSAQRLRFQEEETRFREISNDLKQQAEIAKHRMEEERKNAERISNELVVARNELAAKSKEIDDLSRKLQESLTPSKDDNPIVLANKKVRELELKVQQDAMEIESLSQELSKAKENTETYFKMSQSFEEEAKKWSEQFTSSSNKYEQEIKQLKLSEFNLKARVTELEAEQQIAFVTERAANEKPLQLEQTQKDLKNVLQNLSECNQQLRILQTENNRLSESLNAVEVKYANEMRQHSDDIKELTKLKDDLSNVQSEINKVRSESEAAKLQYEDLKRSNEDSKLYLQKEKEELEARVSDLNELNTKLQNQLEALASKFTTLSQNHSTNSIDESLIKNFDSELNTSNVEVDTKNIEELLQIIKFLRKEKDIAFAKFDIVKAENERLISERDILQKKNDDLIGLLNQERTETEASVVSAMKHEEILRKVETLNAITDSNRILREERDSLSIRVNELVKQKNKLEEELEPLQNQIRDLTAKVEDLAIENSSLRTEAIRWRQRANALVEKNQKNPEEFKRLQSERENLAKMLTSEKELQKQISEEKSRLESDLKSVEKQIHVYNEEKKKLQEELVAIKQNNSRLMLEIVELKSKLLQKEEANQSLSSELEIKEAHLQDSKNKEIQIRKIAKKYKDSFMELSNKTAAATAEGNASSLNENIELAGSSNNEKIVSNNVDINDLRNQIEALNNNLRLMQEENELLRKGNDEMKAKLETKAHDVALSEAERSLNDKLNEVKMLEDKCKNLEAALSKTRTELEETCDRLEKEQIEQNNLKETIARLTRDNEALLMRNNQLTRQVGLQQSAKPSTSSGTICEKASISDSSPRTANVKPMSGSNPVQQSATVTPWRGSDTPLASIRPISVQNSRTAAIIPTSQQATPGGSSSSSTSNTSAGSTNTALVPPQQQVHTTGTSIESMSSSPTSSHTDYIPSTSSTSVAVATIPPMGSATAAESSQEAESVQQQQQNESQLAISGGQQQQQQVVVALVSPRVEGSQNTSPNLQQEPSIQQPSTSGSTSSTSHVPICTHSRHTPTSSSVTTTQAGFSGAHKRPRDIDGDSSTSTEECGSEKANIHMKRKRTALHGNEVAALDVEYQVPTSSQRDQEDDIVVVDSEEDDGLTEADDGPADDDVEHGVYDDSYEQDQDMDESECPEVNGSNIQADIEADNNEAEVDEFVKNQNQYACGNESQTDQNNDASTSQAAAALAYSQSQDHQQSQTISSGSLETSPKNLESEWKQVSSGPSRPQKLQESASLPSESGAELVSSPQGAQFGYIQASKGTNEDDGKKSEERVVNATMEEEDIALDEYSQSHSDPNTNLSSGGTTAKISEEDEENYNIEGDGLIEPSENADSEGQQAVGATQSEILDVDQNRFEASSQDNECADGVSSEGEKQAVGDVEEEGCEAEATVTTRSKAVRGASSTRRPTRGVTRGRPTPIVWQNEAQGNSRGSPNQSPVRGYPNQRSQRIRRGRRPGVGFTRYPHQL